jgi:pyruvate dehydrogenase E2 component (dihydrolipoyllysine-residue acetyltransferase)
MESRVPTLEEIRVPDIGDFKDVEIIELLVKPGDTVRAEDGLIVLESDKATMEVPSPRGGTVKDIKVRVGDRVSEGSSILLLEPEEQKAEPKAATSPQSEQAAEPKAAAAPQAAPTAAAGPRTPERAPAPPAEPPRAASGADSAAAQAAPPPAAGAIDEVSFAKAHASPAVRRFARELGVDLGRIKGSGPKGRILREDIQSYVKALAQARPAPGAVGLAIGELPAIDFSKFGAIEKRPLSRIRKLSGANLHRNWVTVPHVTQHDEADITELEAFRKAQTEQAAKGGVRLTLLAFILKAAVAALKQYPDFNGSLEPGGENLILKHYYHIGVAVDTPDGLVVPVLRDVDKKGVLALAWELGEVSARAREKKLSPSDMQGGTFSISSLGGIGGGAFTPIINAPEVAILGVGRSVMRPMYDHGSFIPRLMLPLSLSYDHRVIDGAAGARFITFLSATLSDIRRLVL